MNNNILTKLLWSVILSLITLYLMWFLIGWVEYGEAIFTKHLDVKATFEQLNGVDFTGHDNKSLMDIFRWSRDLINKTANSGILAKIITNATNGGELSSGLGVFLGAVESLINPIYGILQSIIVLSVLGIVVLEIMYIFLNFTLSFGEFLISPVFI